MMVATYSAGFNPTSFHGKHTLMLAAQAVKRIFRHGKAQALGICRAGRKARASVLTAEERKQ
jgi:hypothetical protein